MFIKILNLILLSYISINCQPEINSQSDERSVVRRIIFWGPSPAESDSLNENDVEVYSDYYYYIEQAAPELKKMGIELKDTSSFELRINYSYGSTEVFTREKGSVAYIFSDGKKKPEIIYNVLVNDEIISAAKEFFGINNGNEQ